jgi:hypothetical protein
MAVDERIKVAAPVNMISAISQGGGCRPLPTCEPVGRISATWWWAR